MSDDVSKGLLLRLTIVEYVDDLFSLFQSHEERDQSDPFSSLDFRAIIPQTRDEGPLFRDSYYLSFLDLSNALMDN